MAASRKKVTDEDVGKELTSLAATGHNGALQILLAQHTSKANRDTKQVPELRAFINAHPDMFKRVSIVAYGIKQALIRKIGGDNSDGTEVVLGEEYQAIFDRLNADGDGDIEKLMITRIAMSWLRVLSAEVACTVLMGSTAHFRELTVADKLLTRAHNRYVKAIESLARIRKLRASAKAVESQASILEMKEKSIRARINASHPGLLSGDRALKAALKKRA